MRLRTRRLLRRAGALALCLFALVLLLGALAR